MCFLVAKSHGIICCIFILWIYLYDQFEYAVCRSQVLTVRFDTFFKHASNTSHCHDVRATDTGCVTLVLQMVRLRALHNLQLLYYSSWILGGMGGLCVFLA